MNKRPFTPSTHIPQITVIFFKALCTPLLVYFALLGNATMFTCAYAFYYLENEVNSGLNSFWDALWWAICTVSTVGYGDIVPLTIPGRIVASVLIILGVCFFLGFMAVLVSAMTSLINEDS